MIFLEKFKKVDVERLINNILLSTKCLKHDKEYVLEIKEFDKNRSSHQNSYLWGVVYKICAEKLGYDVDTVHEVFKTKFGVKKELRKGMIINESTKKYTTIEMQEYIEKIVIFASTFLGINIPDPV